MKPGKSNSRSQGNFSPVGRLRSSAILMSVAILGIAGFQAWWLKNNYDREKQSLEIKTQAAFRQTIMKLQASKLKLERVMLRFDSTHVTDVGLKSTKASTGPATFNKPVLPSEPPISLISLLQERMRDSIRKDSPRSGAIMISVKNDSMRRVQGTMRTISMAGTDSTAITPEMIQEVHVFKGDAPGKMTMRYEVNAHNLKTDSLEPGNKKRDILLARPLPVPVSERIKITTPAGTWENNNTVYQFLYNVDSLSQKDTVTILEIDSAFAERLKEDRVDIGFKVKRLDSTQAVPANAVTIGFSKPASFSLSLQNTFSYMFGKLKLPLLFSLLLVGITIISFVLLWRNMLQQKRLAELKNEFISNITHELKTPIATVGVAIEALKSFNAIHDPRRTEEYLSISQNELQRLNLLVDKVLKLSMFEKKEIELKYETMNLQDIVEEVVSSMRLQIEKYHAAVSVNVEGDCSLQADRLHLLSVVFNLLDNALKYGGENPVIKINLEEKENTVVLSVADNGIGIPTAFQGKVFEKFFRVPQGNIHNAKGYGLGLSYTAHVVKKHGGTIAVDSEPGKGTTFIITIPRQKV